MIRARYRNEGNLHSLVVVGHANYSNQGNDIVCAAVSAIVYSLLGWAENHRDDMLSLATGDTSGEAMIVCSGAAAHTAFEMAVIGLMQIAKRYPDHVAIEYIPHMADDSREQTARKEHGSHA